MTKAALDPGRHVVEEAIDWPEDLPKPGFDLPPSTWAPVETMGLEPTTLCLQSRCSSQLSYVPGRTDPTDPPPAEPLGEPQPARRKRDR
jgi:hypothetical protein